MTKDYYSRCKDCIHFKFYYFDEFDSDCWCEIFDDLKHGYCNEFNKKGDIDG